jgi:hypothetical protein
MIGVIIIFGFMTVIVFQSWAFFVESGFSNLIWLVVALFFGSWAYNLLKEIVREAVTPKQGRGRK